MQLCNQEELGGITGPEITDDAIALSDDPICRKAIASKEWDTAIHIAVATVENIIHPIACRIRRLAYAEDTATTDGTVEYNLRRHCFSRDEALSLCSKAVPCKMPTCRRSGRQGRLSMVPNRFPKEKLS